MKSKATTLAVIVTVLALAGVGLGRLVRPVWDGARERQPALQLDSSAAAAGQGVTLALLGGFRALVADLVWLRMYALWEKRDLAAVETLVRLVTSLDPRPVYFWVNGARIVAYDLPVWRVELAGGFDRVPEPVQSRLGREQAQLALRHLEAAMKFHPHSADLWVERANIELNRLGDAEAAAVSYRQAWEQPGGPYFAARLHGELLRRLGRKTEALDWLRALHPQLPANVEGARADLVLERIRDLENELRVPEAERFQPKQ